MATRNAEQEQQDMDDYASAFGEDMAPTEDVDSGTDASGTPEAGVMGSETEAEVPAEEAPVETEGGEMVEAAPEPVAMEEAPAEEAPMDETPSAPAEDDMSDVPPEDAQAYKSWRGRLKKREEELAAREAALAGQTPAESPAEEVMEEVAEEGPKVSEGSLNEALARLNEDFGEDFVAAIMTIAKSAAESVAGETVSSGTAEAVAALKDLQERFESSDQGEHFDYITDHHPDYLDIAGSDEFKSWLGDKPDMQECCASGTKRAVVKMLNSFKEAGNEADKDEGLDDLVVVQQSGLVIPDKQRKAGFEDAWNEF